MIITAVSEQQDGITRVMRFKNIYCLCLCVFKLKIVRTVSSFLRILKFFGHCGKQKVAKNCHFIRYVLFLKD